MKNRPPRRPRPAPSVTCALPPGTYNPPLGKPGSGNVPFCQCRRLMLAVWFNPFTKARTGYCDHGCCDPDNPDPALIQRIDLRERVAHPDRPAWRTSVALARVTAEIIRTTLLPP